MIKKNNYWIIGILVCMIFASCSNNGGDNYDYDLIPVKQNDMWGYINHGGSFVINPQFKDAECFYDGLARVNYNGKIGYVNKDGKLAINAIYQDGTRFSEGLAFVLTDDDKFLCINTDGKTKFELPDNVTATGIFSHSIAWVMKDGKTSYVKSDGSEAFTFKFDGGSYISEENLWLVVQNSKIGFFDVKGNIVINPQFDNSYLFSEGLCAVYDGSKWGFIKKDGKYAINPQFDETFNFSEGLCAIKQGGKYGYIDKSGRIVVNPQFDGCSNFKNSLAAVNQNGKWGYIDKDGKMVVNPQFDYATEYYGDMAMVVFNGLTGFVNKNGKYEINPQFALAKGPNSYTISIKQAKTAGSTSPRMSFNDAVFQNCKSEAVNIGKKISAAKKLGNPNYNGYYVTYPADVNIKGVRSAYNFWQGNKDLKNGSNTSAIIKSAGIVLNFDNNVSTDEIDNLIEEYMVYLSYDKGEYDAYEFGPDFGHGTTQYGHYSAWVFNSKKYLSYFIDRDDNTVTVYTSYDGKYLNSFMQNMFSQIKKELDGENFENMF